jgi:hypothetical protein
LSINNLCFRTVTISKCHLKGNGMSIWGCEDVTLDNSVIETNSNGIVIQDVPQGAITISNSKVVQTKVDNQCNGIFIIAHQHDKSDIKISSVSITGFGNYGLLLPDNENSVRTVSQVSFDNIILSNCYNSFYSGNAGRYVKYNNIKSNKLGIDLANKKYKGWNFGWSVQKNDEISTRQVL